MPDFPGKPINKIRLKRVVANGKEGTGSFRQTVGEEFLVKKKSFSAKTLIWGLMPNTLAEEPFDQEK